MDRNMIDTKVYVCVKETEDDGKQIVHVFSNKDKAWAWVRDSFVEFTKNYSHIFKENFEWTNTETEHSCWCDYLAYGWYVYEKKIEN